MHYPRKIKPESLPEALAYETMPLDSQISSNTNARLLLVQRNSSVRSDAIPLNCCHHGVAERSTRDTALWWNAEKSVADAASCPCLPTHMLSAHEQANGNKLQHLMLNGFLNLKDKCHVVCNPKL